MLKQKDVRCGLITTRGFRDTLELGRRTRPNQWGISGRFEPLVPGDRRIEVTGGSGAGHDAPAEREAYGGIECLG